LDSSIGAIPVTWRLTDCRRTPHPTSWQKPSQARQRISRAGRTGVGNEPAVIGAVIDLGHCLNLLDAEYNRVVREGYEALQDWPRQLNKPMPENRLPIDSGEHLLCNLDCGVINMVHFTREQRSLPPFDSVRGALIERAPIYDGGRFFEKTHIQVCLRDTGKIKGYFRPISDAAR
jgi:hypothetical protein